MTGQAAAGPDAGGTGGRVCSVPDCERLVVARTLCSVHYGGARRAGSLAEYPTRGQQDRRQRCTVEGCDDYRFGQGLCRRHYDRMRRRGTVELRGPVASVGYVDRYGYRVLYASGHPLARPSGRISEHRLVAFEKFGPGPQCCQWCQRALDWKQASVDHLDGVRLNNAPDNLVLSCVSCNSKRAQAGNPTDFNPREMAK